MPIKETGAGDRGIRVVRLRSHGQPVGKMRRETVSQGWGSHSIHLRCLFVALGAPGDHSRCSRPCFSQPAQTALSRGRPVDAGRKLATRGRHRSERVARRGLFSPRTPINAAESPQREQFESAHPRSPQPRQPSCLVHRRRASHDAGMQRFTDLVLSLSRLIC